MSRLTDKLTALKAEGRTGLIVYLTAGCPDFQVTLQAVQAAEQAGADIIELGIPFSDPMADGPVIQKAATLALRGGANTKKVLELVKEIRQHSQIPLAAMTYINSVMNYGQEKFVETFTQAGLDGVIVPDLPSEEAAAFSDICQQGGLDMIQFVAPTTTPERVERVCRNAGGFIYCISTTGVTGVRQVDYSSIAGVMNVVRQHTNVPLAIGFGIGNGAAARQAARHADAVIVGSAVMQKLMDEGVEGARTLIQSIRQALDKGVN